MKFGYKAFRNLATLACTVPQRKGVDYKATVCTSSVGMPFGKRL